MIQILDMKDTEKDIYNDTNSNSPLGVGGKIYKGGQKKGLLKSIGRPLYLSIIFPSA